MHWASMVLVVICCGKGNNGGDGFVIARSGQCWVRVRVLLFADPERLTGDAAVNYRILAAGGSASKSSTGGLDEEHLRRELAEADWIVDALFGSGLARGGTAAL